MGIAEVRNALQAMDDDSVRSQLAQGDFASLSDAGLTSEERAMVVAAADDFPEVAGFSFKEYTKGWKIEEGETVKGWKIEQGETLTAGSGYEKAVKYSFIKF